MGFIVWARSSQSVTWYNYLWCTNFICILFSR